MPIQSALLGLRHKYKWLMIERAKNPAFFVFDGVGIKRGKVEG